MENGTWLLAMRTDSTPLGTDPDRVRDMPFISALHIVGIQQTLVG